VYSSVDTESKKGSHLWQPGQSGNPKGRPKLQRTDYSREVTYGLAQEWPIARINDLLHEADAYADHHKSWRGKLQVAEFVLNRTLGKPPVMQMGDTSQHDMLTELLQDVARDIVQQQWVVKEEAG
jgi:hypothetical protein